MKKNKGFTPLEKRRRRRLTVAFGNLSLTGFTLVELMIVLLLLSVVVMGLMSSMSSGRKAFYAAETYGAIQDELQKAMRQITYDLRQSSASKVSFAADGTAYTNISFNVSQGVNGLTINWSAVPINYSLTGNQIIREDGITTRVVANNVTNLTFMRQASVANVVVINVSVQKTSPFGDTLNASLGTAVNLRN